MEKKLFNIKKVIAVADLVVKYHQAVNRLIIQYPNHRAILELMLFNLKLTYELQLSLIKSATYEDCNETIKKETTKQTTRTDSNEGKS